MRFQVTNRGNLEMQIYHVMGVCHCTRMRVWVVRNYGHLLIDIKQFSLYEIYCKSNLSKEVYEELLFKIPVMYKIKHKTFPRNKTLKTLQNYLCLD